MKTKKTCEIYALNWFLERFVIWLMSAFPDRVIPIPVIDEEHLRQMIDEDQC